MSDISLSDGLFPRLLSTVVSSSLLIFLSPFLSNSWNPALTSNAFVHTCVSLWKFTTNCDGGFRVRSHWAILNENVKANWQFFKGLTTPRVSVTGSSSGQCLWMVTLENQYQSHSQASPFTSIGRCHCNGRSTLFGGGGVGGEYQMEFDKTRWTYLPTAVATNKMFFFPKIKIELWNQPCVSWNIKTECLCFQLFIIFFQILLYTKVKSLTIADDWAKS